MMLRKTLNKKCHWVSIIYVQLYTPNTMYRSTINTMIVFQDEMQLYKDPWEHTSLFIDDNAFLKTIHFILVSCSYFYLFYILLYQTDTDISVWIHIKPIPIIILNRLLPIIYRHYLQYRQISQIPISTIPIPIRIILFEFISNQ